MPIDTLVGSLVTQVVSDNKKSLYSIFGSTLKAAKDAVLQNYAAYIENSFERCSKVKTLLDRDDPTQVNDIYVKTFLSHEETVIDDDELRENIIGGGAFVIEGDGGSGKSMLMRYLYISLVENPCLSIPVWVDLRDLNEIATKDLLNFIFYSMTGPSGQQQLSNNFNKP